MAKTLIENLNSSYFTAAHQLYSKKVRRKIVAYVESYDDVAFWRMLLEEFETDEYYFEVMLPSSTSLSKGKKMVLMNILNVDELGKSLIACVDSDYDFLLQGATETSRKINESKYVLQTYTYAIENYYCYADALHEVCVQSTLNDKRLFDFNDFMKRYSQIAYPLFLWSVWFYRQHDTHTFPMNDFNSYVRIRDFNFRHPEYSLERMQKEVSTKLIQLQRSFSRLIPQIDALAAELKQLGLLPETTYLYIQGHHIMDNVVLKLLAPVCAALRREREQEIQRLAEHEQQYHNELTSYENSQINVEVMLRRNAKYKELYLYKSLQDDVRTFMKSK
ncbi:MAG: putative transporter ATP-binding protein [Bacteroidetes bacterium]|jgi:hypothetical protein|nr:putative transporter ATP-binding protein [Bacteroidota bacterium]